MLQLKCGRVAGGHLSSPRGAGRPSLVMALPCALGSELIRYFATGGEKKNKPTLSSKPFSLGEKPAWSETSAQKCHLTQQLAHASPGVLRRPLPMSQSRCWRKRARALLLAGSGRSLPPAGFTTPLLPPSSASALQLLSCTRSGFWGARGPSGGRGWRLRPAFPPGRQRVAAVEKDAATLSPVSTSHSFHWRVKISNFFF